MTSEASFFCAVCGEVAGRVQLLVGGEPCPDRSRTSLDALAEVDAAFRPADQSALVVDTFYCVESQPVSAERVRPVAEAITAADAPALYALGYTYASFHCPDCPASYCGEHWTWRRFTDGDISGIEGSCPRGHFHLLCY